MYVHFCFNFYPSIDYSHLYHISIDYLYFESKCIPYQVNSESCLYVLWDAQYIICMLTGDTALELCNHQTGTQFAGVSGQILGQKLDLKEW